MVVELSGCSPAEELVGMSESFFAAVELLTVPRSVFSVVRLFDVFAVNFTLFGCVVEEVVVEVVDICVVVGSFVDFIEFPASLCLVVVAL